MHVYKISKWPPTQRTAVGSAVNSFFDHGNFEALKMLSGGI